MTPTVILLSIYVAAGAMEVIGIFATVTTWLEKTSDGLYSVHQAESRWQAIRGPLFIVLGVLVGLGGNIASLFMPV